MSVVSTSSQSARFSPGDLPELALWLDAADPTTLTLSGNSPRQWNDKSGNGLHFTTSGGQTYANNAVTFAVGGFVMTSIRNFNLSSSTTVFIAAKLAPNLTDIPMLMAFSSINPGGNPGDFSIRYQSSLLRGTQAQPAAGNVSEFASNLTYTVNGTFNPNFGSNVYTSPHIISGTCQNAGGGTPITLSSSFLGVRWFYGDIYEVLIFSSVPTAAQRQQIEGYLARKWNITSMVGHPYRFGGPSILPTSIPGCALWLDAADPTAYTLTGSNVTGVRDKSPSNVTMSVVYGFTFSSNAFNGGYPSFSSAGGSARLGSNASFAVNQPMTVYSVGQATNISGPFLMDGTDFGARVLIYNGAALSSGSGEAVAPNQSSSLDPHVLSVIVNSSSSTIGVNGVMATGSTGSNNQRGIIVGNSISGNAGYVGQICEFLVYSGAHSTTQRQLIEGYLANKWGLNGLLSSPTTPYSEAIIPMRSFSPLDVDGLSLWLDAADLTAFTLSGSNVTSWLDKSGVGNHTSNLTGVTTLSNNAVVFTGTQALGTNLGYAASLNTHTMFAVVSYTSLVGAFIETNVTAGNSGSGLDVFITGGGQHGVNTWGVTFQIRGTTGLTAGTPYLHSHTYTAGGTMSMFLNGALSASTSSGVPSFTSGGFVTLGNWKNGGSYGDFFSGRICEVLIYSNALSSTQRQQVESYLATKWGLRGSMGGTAHPYRYGPPVIGTPATFLPTLQLWLDAADPSAYTLSGSNVTAVRDKSSNAWALGTTANVTLNSTKFNTTYPSFYSTGAGLGSNTSFAIQQPITVYFAGQSLNTWGSAYLFDSIVSSSRVAMNSGALFFAGSADVMPTNNSESLSPHVFCVTYNGANSSIVLNGTTTTGNPGTQGFNGIILSKGDGYRGHICELLMFSGVHTTAQVQAMMGYLAWKWGIPSKLPGVSSNYGRVSRALTPAFVPSQIAGCALWLDAADRSTLTISGSNVSQWRDKSGNGLHVSQSTTALQPTYNATGFNGRPTLRFTGVVGSSVQLLTSATTSLFDSMTSATIFFVFRVISVGTTPPYHTVVAIPNKLHTYLTGLTNAAGFVGSNAWVWSGSFIANSNTTVTQDSNQQIVYAVSPGSQQIYINGIVGGAPTGSFAMPAGTSLTLSIGSVASNFLNDGFNGTLCEVLLYTTALNTSQRQRVEGYLAQKWGLTSTLGGTSHPYRYGPWTNLPTSIPGCALWLDAADATSFDLSGTQIIAWRDKSPASVVLGRSGFPTLTSNGVNFGGSQYFSNTSISLAMSNMSVFLVGYSSAGGGFLSLVPIATGADWNQSNAITYNFEGGLLYTTFDYNATLTNVSNAFGTNPLLFGHIQSNTAMTLYAHGTSYYTASRTMGTTTGLSIGARFQHTNGSVSAFLNGRINEILIYSNALTTTQRQQIEGYLAWKWGLGGNLPGPAYHPYRTFKP